MNENEIYVPGPGICRVVRAGKFRCVLREGHHGQHVEPLPGDRFRSWCFLWEAAERCPGPVVATWPPPDTSDANLATVLDQWAREES